MKDRFIAWFVPRMIATVYHVFIHTTRWAELGSVYAPEQKELYLYAFWHARMLMMPRPFRKHWHGYMLISDHRDGGFIADTMRLLGIPTVRGSTTRGGARAMLQMIRAVKDECRHLGITPDGPRGPCEVVSKGTVQLAMKTGLPVVPICYATSRCWRANSWDRFYIPKPFSRGIFVFGDPIIVEAGDDMKEALTRVQQGMDEVQHKADHYFE
ncbi:MAG: lysophospholipid acyltransferase family protein [Mariprofundaceae bacterium]|nr:lysophospholipid acyltransferase family protein [Mariprofundaceae bacterium]